MHYVTLARTEGTLAGEKVILAKDLVAAHEKEVGEKSAGSGRIPGRRFSREEVLPDL